MSFGEILGYRDVRRGPDRCSRGLTPRVTRPNPARRAGLGPDRRTHDLTLHAPCPPWSPFALRRRQDGGPPQLYFPVGSTTSAPRGFVESLRSRVAPAPAAARPRPRSGPSTSGIRPAGRLPRQDPGFVASRRLGHRKHLVLLPPPDAALVSRLVTYADPTL
ncbi:hypothetical protein Psuf_012850 [Phytohabitans suffuscus]|uniref:Uncharacterized protein n=1 Tax=Phytohabitans suffuscus TaxID=624315 RepID=A0A6F8YCZ3_9ACTN|nr:hypothetical protein Psuf_012850 [Phytohabitans suffuscus]